MSYQHLQAVVLDWAGTVVDYGSRAPAYVFQEIFRQKGIDITQAQAREPMGKAKRDHIAAVAAMPSVAADWRDKFGADCSEADIDALYEQFLPLQKETLKTHSELIPGVAAMAEGLRARGLKIGSTTGYTQELMSVVIPEAKAQGFEADCVYCAGDVPLGRPAPFLLFECAKTLGVYPMWTVVKVDDTPVGIEAGRNAGCWTVGVTRSGNGVGLTEEAFAALGEDEQKARLDHAGKPLTDAGAHALVESVADLPQVLEVCDRLLAEGQFPMQVSTLDAVACQSS